MEGGLSRKRGYTVLVVLLAAALLALFLWRSCHYERPTTETVSVDTTMLAELDMIGQPLTHSSVSRAASSPMRVVSSGDHEGDEAKSPRSRQLLSSEPSSCFAKKGGGVCYPRETSRTIELNTADTAELQRLWGIGPVLSARIVRYRDLLGGFTSKEQLREVYGLADSVYDRIAPRVTADAACVQQLDINTATYGQLLRHPYLDKHQVAAIVRLREKQGAFRSLDDLHQIPIIEQETYTKITPYLSCNSQQKR